jgi:hypothetical protein
VLTTALEVIGLTLIAVAIGLVFGLAAFLGATGVALVVVGIALESRPAPPATSPNDRSSS